MGGWQWLRSRLFKNIHYIKWNITRYPFMMLVKWIPKNCLISVTNKFLKRCKKTKWLYQCRWQTVETVYAGDSEILVTDITEANSILNIKVNLNLNKEMPFKMQHKILFSWFFILTKTSLCTKNSVRVISYKRIGIGCSHRWCCSCNRLGFRSVDW